MLSVFGLCSKYVCGLCDKCLCVVEELVGVQGLGDTNGVLLMLESTVSSAHSLTH